MRKINVAVDGTAGSGKSFIFSQVAKKLGYKLVDTGLIYRALTYFCFLQKVNFEKKQEIIDQLDNFRIEIEEDGTVLLEEENGKYMDVTKHLSGPEVVDNINYVTVIPEVRNLIGKIERRLGKEPGTIELGRDITSVVLPDADLKIYFDSPLEVRAKRRVEQDHEEGLNSTYDAVYKSIALRDKTDKEREMGPLIVVPDAWFIDSSTKPSDETVSEIVNKIRELEKTNA